MLAIFKKELRTYFYSVTGALFAAVNLLVIGLYFMASCLMNMQPSLAAVMQNVLFILLIMVPILTMRILAEEKRQKTDQLLLTAPISVGKIVVGKFLAILAIFGVPVLVSCIFPLIMTMFGKVRYAESYSAILGYFLFGASCIAVGVFISAITESQVIAAVLSFIVLFLTFLMSGIVGILTQSGDNPASLLKVFDFSSRLENLMAGIIDVKEIVYFITVIVLMLFLTCQAIQKRRYSVSKNTISLSVYSNVTVVIGIAIAVVLNLMVDQIPTRFAEIDVTANQMYTLTDDSRKFLSSLDTDIQILVVGTREMMESYDYKEVEKTLDQYAEISDHVTVIYKDPTLDPTFYQKYTTDQVSVGSLIVVNGDRSKVVSPYDLYETSVDYQTYSSTKTGYDGEGQITSAISYVTTDNIPKLYIITGHNEDSLTNFTDLGNAVKKQNVETEELNLMTSGGVPEDADAVMILSPKSDYSEDDTTYVLDYLKKGGKAIITSGYTESDTPNFDSILAYYGLNHVNGVVLEGDQQHMYQTPLYIIPDAGSSTLTTATQSAKLLNLLPQTSGYTVSDNAVRDTVTVEQALNTTDRAYAKTTLAENGESVSAEEDPSDVSGPFVVAAYVTEGADGSDDETKIAVFGTDNLFADQIDAMVAGANVQMVTSALNDMIDQEINTTIPAKSYDTAKLTVPYGTALLLGFVFILVIPVLILASGIVVWFRRRRK
ncbi:ABC-2 type transport system permease protein [Lachnospiraceae bacterium]|nr:ABC-2 type transport system permease protein [Lachnospiraceae bacterium]